MTGLVVRFCRISAFTLLFASCVAVSLSANAETFRSPSSDWTVEVESPSEVTQAMREMIQKTGAPLVFDGAIFEVTRSGPFNQSIQERHDLVDKWQRSLVGALEGEGYEVVDDDQLREMAGLTTTQMREMLLKTQPFGISDITAQVSGQLNFLVNQSSLPCARHNGAMAALILATYPRDYVHTEYGGMIMVFLGGGDCADAFAMAHMARVKRRATEALVERVTLEP